MGHVPDNQARKKRFKFKMSEIALLSLLLAFAFLLGPWMTNQFYLNASKLYFRIHILSLVLMIFGFFLDESRLFAAWPAFCLIGFLIFLNQERAKLISPWGVAACITFVFSLISAVWFFAGSNGLHLLGYNQTWSFYAALHSSYLGWLFVGCMAYLAAQRGASKIYLYSCFLVLFCFLLVAFGINGIPHIKRIGVIALSILIPVVIGFHAWNSKAANRVSRIMSLLSFISICGAMLMAILYEFWPSSPRALLGLPIMVVTHGILNALVTLPCFFLAIRMERGHENSSETCSTEVG